MGTLNGEGDNVRAHMRALAEKAAEELIGTCNKGLHELAEEYGADIENSTAFCARFDELAFECVKCNWFCSQDECNDSEGGEWICDDCKAEEDGDGG